MLIIVLPIIRIPKKIKVIIMMLSENFLAILSTNENPLKKKKQSVTIKENDDVTTCKVMIDFFVRLRFFIFIYIINIRNFFGYSIIKMFCI